MSKTTNSKMSYIIYGYDTLDTIPNSDHIILIEPRNTVIDKFKRDINKTNNKNIKLITKALSDKDKLLENILISDENNVTYHIDNPNIPYHHKRQRVYTTSLLNIINDHNIQNIQTIYFNINISNINHILNSMKPYNHIISNISFKSCVDREIYESNDIFKSFVRQKYISKPPLDNWVLYSHKNLSLELPKICMFFTQNGLTHDNNLQNFIKKYKIDILIDGSILPFNEDNKIIIPNISINNNTHFHKYILNNLNIIFKSDTKYDVIIAFNENILKTQPNFYILYPVKEDSLYINKQYDIIYSCKNAMYNLYEILQSDSFNKWIYEMAEKKPTLVKFFVKRWFYEYISKIFTICKTEI